MAFDDYVANLEACKRTAPDGSEYWMARDLQPLLGYDRWENFSAAIERAREACRSAGVSVIHQVAEGTKMVNIGSGGRREMDDWFLSRYACYLIALNSDPSKPEVGVAQTYFLVRTRQQEIEDTLTDVQRRKL